MRHFTTILFVASTLLGLGSGQGQQGQGYLIPNFIPGWFYPRPTTPRPPVYNPIVPGKPIPNPNLPPNQVIPGPTRCYLGGGPYDPSTLTGQNFLENYGSGRCLSLEKNNYNNIVNVGMGVCNWNSPVIHSAQLFKLYNGNGGSLIKTSIFGRDDMCLATTGFGNLLKGETCSNSGKDFSQTWRFIRIRENLYQIIQLSTNMCMKVDGNNGNNYNNGTPSVVRCSAFDNSQLWRICTMK